MRVIPFGEYGRPDNITLRLAPIDVGFDLRAGGGMTIAVPADTTVASYEYEGECLVVEGSAEEVWETLESAGYTLVAGVS